MFQVHEVAQTNTIETWMPIGCFSLLTEVPSLIVCALFLSLNFCTNTGWCTIELQDHKLGEGGGGVFVISGGQGHNVFPSYKFFSVLGPTLLSTPVAYRCHNCRSNRLLLV